MVVVPAWMPVAVPSSSIVATSGVALAHVTSVSGWMRPIGERARGRKAVGSPSVHCQGGRRVENNLREHRRGHDHGGRGHTRDRIDQLRTRHLISFGKHR